MDEYESTSKHEIYKHVQAKKAKGKYKDCAFLIINGPIVFRVHCTQNAIIKGKHYERAWLQCPEDCLFFKDQTEYEEEQRKQSELNKAAAEKEALRLAKEEEERERREKREAWKQTIVGYLKLPVRLLVHFLSWYIPPLIELIKAIRGN